VSIYCDVDSATLVKHPPSLLGDVTVETAAATQQYTTLGSNAFVNTASHNRGAHETTVARQSVNTTLHNSGTYHVTVFYVVHAAPK
jgi:hypothetical protein